MIVVIAVVYHCVILRRYVNNNNNNNDTNNEDLEGLVMRGKEEGRERRNGRREDKGREKV